MARNERHGTFGAEVDIGLVCKGAKMNEKAFKALVREVVARNTDARAKKKVRRTDYRTEQSTIF